jgi:hypothetical protein
MAQPLRWPAAAQMLPLLRNTDVQEQSGIAYVQVVLMDPILAGLYSSIHYAKHSLRMSIFPNSASWNPARASWGNPMV